MPKVSLKPLTSRSGKARGPRKTKTRAKSAPPAPAGDERGEVMYCEVCADFLPRSSFFEISWQRKHRRCKTHFSQLHQARHDASHESHCRRILERTRSNFLRDCGMQRSPDSLSVGVISDVLRAWKNRSVYSGLGNCELSLARIDSRVGLVPENLIPFTCVEMGRRIHRKVFDSPQLEAFLAQKIAQFRKRLRRQRKRSSSSRR